MLRLRGVACFICLVALASGQSAFAVDPGACQDTADANCSDANTCKNTSTPCKVTVADDGQGVASVSFNGTSQQFVCLFQGQKVQWVEDERDHGFVVQFATGATPFGTTSSFSGYYKSPTNTPSVNPGPTCYKFSVLNYPTSVARCATPGVCGTVDPKVIVSGGVLIKPKNKNRGKAGQQQPK